MLYGRQVRCNLVIELLFDDEVCLSDSEIRKEEGKNAYYYRGEACLTKELVEDFSSNPLVVLRRVG